VGNILGRKTRNIILPVDEVLLEITGSARIQIVDTMIRLACIIQSQASQVVAINAITAEIGGTIAEKPAPIQAKPQTKDPLSLFIDITVSKKTDGDFFTQIEVMCNLVGLMMEWLSECLFTEPMGYRPCISTTMTSQILMEDGDSTSQLVHIAKMRDGPWMRLHFSDLIAQHPARFPFMSTEQCKAMEQDSF